MHSEAALPGLLVPTIRSAKSEDGPALVKLINRAFRVEERFIPGPRIDEEQIAERLDTGRFLVADSVSGPAGAVYVDTRLATARIELLAVRPDQQGRGIGQRLLDVAEALCRAEGCRVVELEVVDLRHELVGYYRRQGYHVDGQAEIGAPTTLPCHFVVMHKPLGADTEAQ